MSGNVLVNGGNTAGNLVVDSGTTGGTYSQGVNNGFGNISLKGDIVFTGTNPWILHTPNNTETIAGQAVNRMSLYLAPNSEWARQTRFDATGDVAFSQNISVGQTVTIGSRLSVGNVSCTTPAQCTGLLNLNNITMAVGGRIGAQYGIHVVNYGGTWPDYVFAPAYVLPALPEVERFIQANHHLPDVPSAAQVQAEGIELAGMEAVLLKKVEELTLHLIQLQKDNAALSERMHKLEH